jgi:hypothetical protein
MRRYGESHEKAVQSTIEEYRRAAGFIKPLRDTLDKYAGKVYNKRFLEALRTAAGYDRIYDDRRADMIFIYYYSPDHYDQRTICRIALQGRRIDGKQSKASAADYYAKHLESAAKLEEIAPQIDTIRARLEELDRMKKTIVGGIPYELRDIYGIH